MLEHGRVAIKNSPGAANAGGVNLLAGWHHRSYSWGTVQIYDITSGQACQSVPLCMEVDFMKKRVNTAFWVEKEKRWCIAVQKNGTRKRFYSSTPGRTGQREANAKADAWLDDSIRDGKKKVAALYAQWVEELKLTCGTSYVTQCQRYGGLLYPADLWEYPH